MARSPEPRAAGSWPRFHQPSRQGTRLGAAKVQDLDVRAWAWLTLEWVVPEVVYRALCDIFDSQKTPIQ